MIKKIKVLNQETLYNGFFKLELYTIKHTLYSGDWSPSLKRELFGRGEAVAVVLYDPERDETVLIEQFRVGALNSGAKAWLWEIVAGAIEEGESAKQVAAREAMEEAGCMVTDLFEVMQFYTTPGACSERISLFCARVDSTTIGGVHGLAEEGEDILVKAVKVDHIITMLENNAFESAIPILALQWLINHRTELQQRWLTKYR